MRHFEDWLTAYTKHAAHMEAPEHLHWWTGISTIAGALSRHVWFDQKAFQWYPNHYIIFVGPPEVVAKSTTLGLGMSLLRKIEDGFLMGPNSCSWQALVQYLKEHGRSIEVDGAKHVVNAVTCSASEFGVFMKTDDENMQNVLIDLWDGAIVDKVILKAGSTVKLDYPLLNLNGCTTPSWIKRSITTNIAEGGLFSRMTFIYAEEKERIVSYPADVAPPEFESTRAELLDDLIDMTTLRGAYTLEPAAKEFGTRWYESIQHKKGDPEQILTRRQMNVHKIAMCIAASRRSSLVISLQDFKEAVSKIELLDSYRRKILSYVGQSPLAGVSEDLVRYIKGKKRVKKEDAYRYMLSKLPTKLEFDNILSGLSEAGYITMREINEVTYILFNERSE